MPPPALMLSGQTVGIVVPGVPPSSSFPAWGWRWGARGMGLFLFFPFKPNCWALAAHGFRSLATVPAQGRGQA